MSKFKSSVAVYKDFINLIKSNFDELIFIKFFERVSHSFSIDEDELIDEKDIASFYFKTNQRVNFLYDLALTYSEKYLTEDEWTKFEFELASILKLYHKNDIAIKLFQKIISRETKNPKQKKVLADCYMQVAQIYGSEAKWKEFERSIKVAGNLYEEINDQLGEAEYQFVYGSVFLEKGEIEAAKVRFDNVEKYLKNLSNKLLRAKLDNNLGILNLITGNYSDAKAKLNIALKAFEELEILPFQAEVKLNLGIVTLKLKDFAQALIHFDDTKLLAIRSLSIQNVALSLMYKANVFIAKNEFKRAQKIIDQATTISYHINDNLTVADLFKMSGIIAQNLDKFDLAEDMLLTSLRINQELNNKLNTAETSIELALLYRKLKQYSIALSYAKDALNYFQKIESEDIAKDLNILVNSLKYEIERQNAEG